MRISAQISPHQRHPSTNYNARPTSLSGEGGDTPATKLINAQQKRNAVFFEQARTFAQQRQKCRFFLHDPKWIKTN
ncbi:MAG: hypothetical protein KGL40_02855 [Rhodocyclaceae bacterium]|nr:hypothetical protein [Rhodocyclaceae bacterium]